MGGFGKICLAIKIRHVLQHRIFLNLFLISCALLCGCVPMAKSSKKFEHPKNSKIAVIFTYKGRAKTVCLCGDFNHWSPNTDCLKWDGKVWKIRIFLPPGRYRYLFLIDNKRWVCDPKAYLNERDGYGRKNSVLILE